MHVPDGFLDAPTSVATGVVSAAVVAVAVKRSSHELTERSAPMAGLVAAFVFAAQMINFAVGAGTSGHLIGGALAAALVGPWTAVLCLTVVLLVQGLLFADGGLSALGTNILLMGIVTTVVAWAVMGPVTRMVRSRAGVLGSVAVGSYVSVPVAALVFVGLYEVGGAVDVPLGTLASSMLGVHLVIGLGEAAITTLVVASVLSVRPDIVYAARHLSTAPELEIRHRDQAGVLS